MGSRVGVVRPLSVRPGVSSNRDYIWRVSGTKSNLALAGCMIAMSWCSPAYHHIINGSASGNGRIRDSRFYCASPASDLPLIDLWGEGAAGHPIIRRCETPVGSLGTVRDS